MSFERTILDELHEIRNEIKLLRGEINQYKGFAGGIVWAMSACIAVLTSVYWFFKNGGHHT